MIDVVVVLVEGGMPSTAIAPVEIFSGAGALWNDLLDEPKDPAVRVRTATIDGKRTETGVPVTLQPDCSIEEIESADLIFVSAPAADLETALDRHAALLPWLQRWWESDTTIAGACAGACLLAEAGLVDGRPATTHWALVEKCQERYPEVDWKPERLITECDDILCSGGVYSAVDLSLYLVETYCGHQVAMQTAKALVLRTPRTWQAGYTTAVPKITHDDAQIRAVQEWLCDHYSDEIRVEDLASRAGMSPRTFSRRFKAATGETPLRYLQHIRINAAKHLLENDLKTIQEVSWAVGYENVGFFRRLFKRHTGTPPQQYRKRFGVSPPENMAISGKTPHQ